jgi:hypothetical protein
MSSPAAASAPSSGRITPSWGAVIAVTTRAPGPSRHSGRSRATGSDSPATARSSEAAASDTARSTISPSAPPPAVCTWSSWTPNSRCTGPWDASIAWMRPIGTDVSSGETTPRLKWSASPATW